jgi:hypothetical protein
MHVMLISNDQDLAVLRGDGIKIYNLILKWVFIFLGIILLLGQINHHILSYNLVLPGQI